MNDTKLGFVINTLLIRCDFLFRVNILWMSKSIPVEKLLPREFSYYFPLLH